MLRVDIVYFDAGGGHRSAANALKLICERQGRPWDIRLVNLQELLDSLDVFRKVTGVRLQDLYNNALNRGWTLGSPQLTRLMQAIIRVYHRREVEMLTEFWKTDRPRLVVSVVPNFNRAMREALNRMDPALPFVTILTDIADYPPHFWIERQEQFLICGSDKAVNQARELGHSDHRVFRTSGMILHPKYYEVHPLDRAAERTRLGLDPAKPTGIMMFGGQGSNTMLSMTRTLDASGLDLQLILICGRNIKLAEALKGLPTRLPKFVEGFTAHVPYYMALSDFFVGKPGPGSISEAIAMSLPVIVENNSWTLPQERYNTQWVREREVGLVVRSFTSVANAVGRMLEPGVLDRFRANAAAIRNRAVFEIPDILERVLAGSK